MIRFLANENIPITTVRDLRLNGFYVLSLSEFSPGITDIEVMKLAQAENLVILTFDRDYGNLVYRQGIPLPSAIIYLRLSLQSTQELTSAIINFIHENKEVLLGNFWVLTNTLIRKRLLPEQD